MKFSRQSEMDELHELVKNSIFDESGTTSETRQKKVCEKYFKKSVCIFFKIGINPFPN